MAARAVEMNPTRTTKMIRMRKSFASSSCCACKSATENQEQTPSGRTRLSGNRPTNVLNACTPSMLYGGSITVGTVAGMSIDFFGVGVAFIVISQILPLIFRIVCRKCSAHRCALAGFYRPIRVCTTCWSSIWDSSIKGASSVGDSEEGLGHTI